MHNKTISRHLPPSALGFAAFVIIIAGIMYAESIISPLLMAAFISIICLQPIRWLKEKKLSLGLSIAIVFTSIIILFIVFGEIIGSSLSSFADNASLYEENLLAIMNSMHGFLDSYGMDIPSEKFTKLFQPEQVMGLTAGILGQLGGFMGNTLTIIFLVLFLLFEMNSIAIKAEAIAKSTNASLEYLHTIGNSIRHYLSIKTMTSLLTGLIIWLGLTLVGVDYAVIWGLIAFLLNYIPNIGSIIAAFPAVLFAAVQLGFGGVIWTTIIFIVVNVIIGSVIEPKLMGKGMGLSTFIVFIALIFWGFVLGTVGMFLSVPLTMAIKIALEQNERTKWIAVVLGTEEDAKNI